MPKLDELRSRPNHPAAFLETTFREHLQSTFTIAVHDAICAYVDAMKAEGALVEQVIVNLKHIAQRGYLAPNSYFYLREVPQCEQNSTMQQAVSLVVGRYYCFQ
jgi:hypothetical protein